MLLILQRQRKYIGAILSDEHTLKVNVLPWRHKVQRKFTWQESHNKHNIPESLVVNSDQTSPSMFKLDVLPWRHKVQRKMAWQESIFTISSNL